MQTTKKPGVAFAPTFCPEGVDPYETVTWGTRTAEIKNEKGEVVFRQEGVEFPTHFSNQAVNIVASKHFAGDVNVKKPVTEGGRETSLRQLIERIVTKLHGWGLADGYFQDDDHAASFRDDLKWLMLHQYGWFNSPVCFNVGLDLYGIEGTTKAWRWRAPWVALDGYKTQGDAVPLEPGESYTYPQGSACFLVGVEDDMESIAARGVQEMMLFKYGSGAGSDNSRIRSSREKLSGGGSPSGPLSFMRIYDRIGGVVKSGGKSRRAAKMDILRCDHPDIAEFIDAKAVAEKMARSMIKDGWDGGFNGEVYGVVPFQNCNMSVNALDSFMAKWAGDDPDPFFQTIAVTTGTDVANNGKRMPTYNAMRLGRSIAEGTHLCGDPGTFYGDTVNRWHTCPNSGPIRTSNPCLRRGARLLTAAGWQRVEDLAAEGQPAEHEIFDGVGFVKGKVWYTGRKSLVRLHVNSGETVDLTPDHRVYTTDGWIEAKECEGKTIPRVVPNVGSTGSNALPRAITGASGRFYNTTSIDLMEALGFIQGDGGFRPDIGVTTVHYTPDKDGEFVEATVLPVLQDIAADKGEIDYKAGPIGDDRHGYAISRKKLTDWLGAIGFVLQPLPGRVLPNFLWKATQNSQAAFLRGLFGANGNVLKDARNAVNLVSTCRKMLQEVQLLLRPMGIVSAVRVHNKAQDVEWANGTYKSREAYRLEITHQQDIAAFSRLIGFPQDSQRAKLKLAISTRPASKNDASFSKRAFMEIVRVEVLTEQDDVYDFNAATTSMGVCDGLVVHNCVEFNFLDHTACNLASLNFMKFRREDGTFDVARFRAACRVFITAQEILVDHASYPSRAICENSHRFRPLGLGGANLGSLLMASGLPYDSDEGRALAGAVTAVMTGEAYLTSAGHAANLGPFEGFALNREPMLNVMRMHHDAVRAHAHKMDGSGPDDGPVARMFNDLPTVMERVWAEAVAAGKEHGYRNSQVSLYAPTGTIGFAMDCDTTGLEPEIALVKYKSLAGGGMLKIVNQTVPVALEALGYGSEPRFGPLENHPGWGTSCTLPSEIEAIVKYVDEHDTIEGCPDLRPDHLPVFDCAFKPAKGSRSIHWRGHVKMLAAVQPFISGSSSKTINMNEDATVEEIEEAYVEGWRLGVKALAIYRDNSKGSQPVSTSKDTVDGRRTTVLVVDEAVATPTDRLPVTRNGDASYAPRREKLPDKRRAEITKFKVGGFKGYMTVGLYEDGRPGELFLTTDTEGSFEGGLLDVIGTLTSLALQYGVPLDALVRKFSPFKFEPMGPTGDPDVPIVPSVVSYIFRRLGTDFVPGYKEEYSPAYKAALKAGDPSGDPTAADAVAGHLGTTNGKPSSNGVGPSIGYTAGLSRVRFAEEANPQPPNPKCEHCGGPTVRAGRCHCCTACGTSVGGCS